MSNAPQSFKQGDSIAAYRIVRHTSTPNTVALASATTDVLLGITQDEAQKSNQAVPVALSGVSKLYMNDTCAAGALVTTDSVGRGVPATANTAGVNVIGVCLNTVSATGTLAEVAINPYQIQIP
jgi:hypothetical protein